MTLNKSYRLLNFLNRTHGLLTRSLFALLGYSGVLLVTGSARLAAQMSRSFMHDQFKLALRRCGWYARTGWPGLHHPSDPFFDFTEGLNGAERVAARRFLDSRAERLPRHVYLADCLYLAAAELHARLEEGEVLTDAQLDAFYQGGNTLLQNLPTPRQPGSAQAEPREREDDFCRDDARQALADFAQLFPLDQWHWYVISGTFLGLVRENGFLAHDYDIDLGINAEAFDLQRMLRVLTGQQRFVMKKLDEHYEVSRGQHGRHELRKYPALVKLIHCSGINLDLFIHHLQDGVRWHGSIIHRWDNHDFALQPYHLEAVEVRGPADADRYLTENYGDWRTPVKSFDCTTGTPNLAVARNFLSLALFLKRLAIFSAENPAQAIKLRRALLASAVLMETEQGLQMRRYL